MKRRRQFLFSIVCLVVAGSAWYAFFLAKRSASAVASTATDLRHVPAMSPSRIVSLVPAVTEILFTLGAWHQLVGRTRWGIHPPAARTISDVGDGMRPSLEVVLSVEPDLVLLYDGAGNQSVAQRLESMGVRTLSLRHDTLSDLERNIILLGGLVGCPTAASELVARIRTGLEEVASARPADRRTRVYWDAWPEPAITIGAGSFLDSLLQIAGAKNVFDDQAGSAPRVSLEAIIYRDPDRILVPIAPSTFGIDPELSGRPGWDRIPAVRQGRISVLNQDLVSRMGPRVVDAAWAISRAIYPELSRESSLPRIPLQGPPCNG